MERDEELGQAHEVLDVSEGTLRGGAAGQLQNRQQAVDELDEADDAHIGGRCQLPGVHLGQVEQPRTDRVSRTAPPATTMTTDKALCPSPGVGRGAAVCFTRPL
ncbi:hypothetical protein [Streptomyces sp. C10]|uniref:hypothetical protein n=1 Tax=Streptomyces sp. C10 TaxID=531941 RepID=UPI00397F3742